MSSDYDALTSQADEQIAAFAKLEAYASRSQQPGATPTEVAERLRTLATAYHEIDHSWPVAARSAIEQVERERQEALAAPAKPKKGGSWRERVAGILGGAIVGALACAIACFRDTSNLDLWVLPFGMACGGLPALLARRRAGAIRCSVRGALAFELGLVGIYICVGLRYGWALLTPQAFGVAATFAVIGAASGLAAWAAARLVRGRSA